MLTPNKIDVAAYFEGVYIPVNYVSVQSEIGRPPVANISMPCLGKGKGLMLTTTVAIFCRCHPNDTPETPVVDAYKLIFHGEITSTGMSREGMHVGYMVRAEAPTQYLNKMPNQFAWAYTREQHAYALDDYNFLGLKYGGSGRDFAVRWFTDGTLLQLANTGKSPHAERSGLNPTADAYTPYVKPATSGYPAGDAQPVKTLADAGFKDPTGTPRGVGANRANATRYHQGEDYALESGVPRGAPLYIPYDDCIMGYCSKEGGSIRFQSPDKKHKIVIYHAIDVQTQHVPGTKMKAGTMVGRVGNVKTSANHLHIELWSDYDSGSGEYYRYDYDLGLNKNRVTRDLANNPAAVKSQGIYGIYHIWPDCLMRILGRGRYAGGSVPDVESEMTRYSLKEYVHGLLDALATCVDTKEPDGKYYSFYANANTRHRIKDSHLVADFPADGFDNHYGADAHNSYMNHTYSNLSRYRASMHNYLIGNLSTIGYIGYTVISPMFDRVSNRLNEYITTPAFYYHSAPQFNVVTIGVGDNVNILDGGTPTTAMKYKSISNDLSVREFYSPASMASTSLRGNYEDAIAEVNHKDPSVVEREKIYGISRKVEDIGYYYESFLSKATSPDASDSSRGMVQRLCDMNRVLSSGDVSSVNAAVAGLNLNLVSGLPAIVHCPYLGKDYYGFAQQVTHTIDLLSGYSSTSISLAFSTCRIRHGGVSPDTVMDMAIDAGLNKFYRDTFYGGDDDAVFCVSQSEGLVDADRLPYANRALCSMRDFLRLNKHQAISQDDSDAHIGGYTNIRSIDNFVTTSEGGGAEPMTTIEANASDLIKIDKISDMYILEKYNAALAMAREVLDAGRALSAQGD